MTLKAGHTKKPSYSLKRFELFVVNSVGGFMVFVGLLVAWCLLWCLSYLWPLSLGEGTVPKAEKGQWERHTWL